MKHALFLIVLYLGQFTAAPLSAQEFSPIVQIMNIDTTHRMQYSGVIVKEDDSAFYILTCAHGVQDLTAAQIKLQTNIFTEKFGSIKVVGVKTDLIKFDRDIDLGYMKFDKVGPLKIRPMLISKSTLTVGTKLTAQGYVNSRELIISPMIIKSYTRVTTQNLKPILECGGEAIHGLSGCPLVYEDVVYGIQSSGSKTATLFCPSDQLLEFIKGP